ncbi:MAG: AAA family ATPase, partial [Thermoleophilia bacterium]
MIAADADPREGRIPLAAPASLRPFVEAGILGAADVHVARALARIVDEGDDAALLGAALAVRAPRLGHVCVDLAGVRESAVPSDDSAPEPVDLPWPEPGAWTASLRASALAGEGGPMRLEGSLLYLDRYWGQERAVAADLLGRANAPAVADPATLGDPLSRLFPGETFAEQRAAAATALRRRLSVVAGGPGTGKTTTIARLLALVDQVEGMHPRRVALAAPTGKAAARLEEAVHEEAATMEIGDETRARLLALGGSTIHRLLGRRPDSESRFRHDRANPLPHTLVVVDEASMVSLSLMARLLEALREDARLVLVGDPEQLVSVEAGAVLGDVVGPARAGAKMRPDARRAR